MNTYTRIFHEPLTWVALILIILLAVQYGQEQNNKELSPLTIELGIPYATEYLTSENIWLVDENGNPILKDVHLSKLEMNGKRFVSLAATPSVSDTVQLEVELQKNRKVIHSKTVEISPQPYTDPLRETYYTGTKTELMGTDSIGIEKNQILLLTSKELEGAETISFSCESSPAG